MSIVTFGYYLTCAVIGATAGIPVGHYLAEKRWPWYAVIPAILASAVFSGLACAGLGSLLRAAGVLP